MRSWCFCSVLCLLCLCARLFICALWSPAGKGLSLGSRLWCLLWVCHFPIGILGQVWYLIVSIPDLCTLTYFENFVLSWVEHNLGAGLAWYFKPFFLCFKCPQYWSSGCHIAFCSLCVHMCVSIQKVRNNSRIKSSLRCTQSAFHVVLCTKKAPLC